MHHSSFELGHAFPSSCEVEEIAQKVAVSINPGQRIKKRFPERSRAENGGC